MDIEAIREYCLSFPHATEDVKWGNDLVFSIGGKMFAVAVLDAASPVKITFKCTPEIFAKLIEQEDIIPAPYAARYYWVALQRWDVLNTKELKAYIKDSYEMVLAKLPKKVRNSL